MDSFLCLLPQMEDQRTGSLARLGMILDYNCLNVGAQVGWTRRDMFAGAALVKKEPPLHSNIQGRAWRLSELGVFPIDEIIPV